MYNAHKLLEDLLVDVLSQRNSLFDKLLVECDLGPRRQDEVLEERLSNPVQLGISNYRQNT